MFREEEHGSSSGFFQKAAGAIERRLPKLGKGRSGLYPGLAPPGQFPRLHQAIEKGAAHAASIALSAMSAALTDKHGSFQ